MVRIVKYTCKRSLNSHLIAQVRLDELFHGLVARLVHTLLRLAAPASPALGLGFLLLHPVLLDQRAFGDRLGQVLVVLLNILPQQALSHSPLVQRAHQHVQLLYGREKRPPDWRSLPVDPAQFPRHPALFLDLCGTAGSFFLGFRGVFIVFARFCLRCLCVLRPVAIFLSVELRPRIVRALTLGLHGFGLVCAFGLFLLESREQAAINFTQALRFVLLFARGAPCCLLDSTSRFF